jgi:hypothetical protein
MAKLIGTHTAFTGRKNPLQIQNPAVSASAGSTGLFGWIPWDRLKDHMIGMWGMIRRGSAAEDPAVRGRIENLQGLDELQSRAYLDIRRNII